MRKILTTLILSCIAAISQAGTIIDFSGVINHREVDGGINGYFSDDYPATQVGDTFQGHIEFHSTNNFFVGMTIGDVGFSFSADALGTNVVDGGIASDGRSGWFYNYYGPFGGTDFTFFYDVNGFGLGDYINPGGEDGAFVAMGGQITEKSVSTPDTGNTLAMLIIGGGVLLLLRSRLISKSERLISISDAPPPQAVPKFMTGWIDPSWKRKTANGS